MRKPAFDKIFDPNDPERQEVIWRKYRMIALSVMLIFCVLYVLFVGDSSNPTTPDPSAPDASSSAQPELTNIDDVDSFTAELQIGSEISNGLTSLTLVDAIELQSSADGNNHGITVGIPKRVSSGAGDEVLLGEPKISIIMLDQVQIEDSWIEGGHAWWKLKLGPQATRLAPGVHSYDLMASIDQVSLFSQTGGGSLTFPMIPPSSANVGRAQVAVVLPDYAKTDAIAARAWIAKASRDNWPSDEREEIPGAFSVRPAAGLSKERRAITFTSPRRLSPMEGIWIQVNW